MQPEVRARLQHIIEAGEKIQRATAGKTFTDYTSDEILPPAVERLFSIVGEALREATRLEPGLPAHITGYRRIIDFRNILVHGYATVYDEGVWRIIQKNLPLRLAEVRALLAE